LRLTEIRPSDNTLGLLHFPGMSRSACCWPKCQPASNGRRMIMARKPATRAEFVLFDVFYEDGSRRSNRRVPSEILGGLDGDTPARAMIKEQDRLIAEKSGNPILDKSSRASADLVPDNKAAGQRDYRRAHASD
jgi:hypothetical protein